MRVTLKHPASGRLKFVETGWSWSLFLGAGALGLPLFFRGMALWGAVMVVLWSLQLAEPFIAPDGGTDTLDLILMLAVAGLCLFLGYRGNALTARHYLACGYEFAEPDSLEARVAAQSWGL
ncbi:MAG TPA: hypothetical protein VMV26_06530 [Alphaproteobacteria bacterium]|nr:hypothetical protein [Alphaproteobacteria bacterium]